MKKRRIYLVEDHPIFRLGLRELVNAEEDLEVCGEAADVAEAAAGFPGARPDLLVVDLALKGRNGVELIKEVHRDHPELPVLVVSMYDESLYADRALAAGARGYVMKQEASDSIVRAIRSVLEGNLHVSPKTMARLAAKMVGQGASAGRPPIERLTDRELEILRMIAQGLTTGEIARRLSLSVKTIGTYKERMKEKLNLKTAAELNIYAAQWSDPESALPADPSGR